MVIIWFYKEKIEKQLLSDKAILLRHTFCLETVLKCDLEEAKNEKQLKLLFRPISSTFGNFYPRNISDIPVVKISKCFDIERKH